MLLKTAYRALCLFLSLPALFLPRMANAQALSPAPSVASSAVTTLELNHVEHAYGLPDTKAKTNGTLRLDASSLTFTSKASNTTIPRSAITSVSAGSDRVELWGTGGRLMRMAIPQGGGLAAAAFMHHRIGMLTVEFHDTRGALHAAVFYVPVAEAQQALRSMAQEATHVEPAVSLGCGSNPIEPRSVFVELPNWDHAQVPPAYRALVYEHVIDRLKATKGVGHVYRVGELGHGSACPQYTLRIAIERYSAGNQVVRAATGPIGMFTSATQMTFAVSYFEGSMDDAKTPFKSDEIKASVRTESESTSVADAVAKKLAKQYGAILKQAAAHPSSRTGVAATHA